MTSRPDIDLELTQRNQRVEIKITADDKKRAQIAAAMEGKNLSEFIRSAMRERARRVLAERSL
jgi:uncharacterized protein (DUF1778 family)